MKINSALLPVIETRTFLANISGNQNDYTIPDVSNYQYIEISLWYNSGVFDVKTFPINYIGSLRDYGIALNNVWHVTISSLVYFKSNTSVTVSANASDSLVRIVGITKKTAWET